jgi:hypothetical protein
LLDELQKAYNVNPKARVHIVICDHEACEDKFYFKYLGSGFRCAENEEFGIEVLKG